MDVDAIGPTEAEAFFAAARAAFHSDPQPDELRLEQRLLEPERALVVRDRRRIVATACAYRRLLTVPGGAVAAAAVSQVGVRPTHRRRGLLSALMRRQLADLRAEGVPVAVLWASEGAIYQRFGYGLAARGIELRVRTAVATQRPGLPRAGEVVLASLDEARPAMEAVHEAVRPRRPGLLDRPPGWWEHQFWDPERDREGHTALRAAVVHDAGGAPNGYAVYATKDAWSEHGPDGATAVRELLAVTPEAETSLWDYLLGLDLIRTLTWGGAALDEPLPYRLLATDAAAVRASPTFWLRLTDVRAALEARAYALPFELVLEVEDAELRENAGRVRLTWDGRRAACEPATAPPDLAIDAKALGTAYLGGAPLSALTGGDEVRERRPGALALLARAFRGDREPWAIDNF